MWRRGKDPPTPEYDLNDAEGFARRVHDKWLEPALKRMAENRLASTLAFCACVAGALTAIAAPWLLHGAPGTQAVLIALGVDVVLCGAPLACLTLNYHGRHEMALAANERRWVVQHQFGAKREIAIRTLRAVERSECSAGSDAYDQLNRVLNATLEQVGGVMVQAQAQTQLFYSSTWQLVIVMLAAGVIGLIFGCVMGAPNQDWPLVAVFAVLAMAGAVAWSVLRTGLGRDEALLASLAPPAEMIEWAAEAAAPYRAWMEHLLTIVVERDAFYRRPPPKDEGPDKS